VKHIQYNIPKNPSTKLHRIGAVHTESIEATAHNQYHARPGTIFMGEAQTYPRPALANISI